MAKPRNPPSRKIAQPMIHTCHGRKRDRQSNQFVSGALIFDSSTYHSQRCHVCGLVLKSHRQSKAYSCTNCGWEGDADFNSACNHQQNLPDLTDLRRLKLNRKGFFWKESGLFDLTGEEIAVSLTEE
jgi:predicted RNA-binding Zn-ribbon protein involved in translation (DUF1610 family)